MMPGAGGRWGVPAILWLCILGAGTVVPARATPIAVGVLSLVTTDPGAVGFQIANYSGDQALAPDFPVTSPLTWTDLSFTYTVTGSSIAVPLSNLGPGLTTAVNLPDATIIDSASLSGALTRSSFIVDGVCWQAAVNGFFVELQPGMGSALTPDFDFAVISVDADEVPEPATALLILAGLGLIRLIRR